MIGNDISELQVGWYQVHGKYPAIRIRHDNKGNRYVIGDWSWIRIYPQYPEPIEHLMPPTPAKTKYRLIRQAVKGETWQGEKIRDPKGKWWARGCGNVGEILICTDGMCPADAYAGGFIEVPTPTPSS